MNRRRRYAMVIALCLMLAKCSNNGPYAVHLREAEEYTRKKQYSEAIESYREHIEERLAVEDRPEWENPHFYLIIIGDLQVAQKDIDGALKSFEEAEAKGVDKGLVSDRYRYAASWYEKEGKLDEAIAILKRYRDRDPLLFDLTLDRLGREQVAREEEKGAQVAVP